MSDIADKANDLMAMQTQIAIDRHRANTQQMVHTSPFCDECGDEIPAKRSNCYPTAPIAWTANTFLNNNKGCKDDDKRSHRHRPKSHHATL